MSRVRHRAWHDVFTLVVPDVGKDLRVVEDFLLTPLTPEVLGVELPVYFTVVDPFQCVDIFMSTVWANHCEVIIMGIFHAGTLRAKPAM